MPYHGKPDNETFLNKTKSQFPASKKKHSLASCNFRHGIKSGKMKHEGWKILHFFGHSWHSCIDWGRYRVWNRTRFTFFDNIFQSINATPWHGNYMSKNWLQHILWLNNLLFLSWNPSKIWSSTYLALPTKNLYWRKI